MILHMKNFLLVTNNTSQPHNNCVISSVGLEGVFENLKITQTMLLGISYSGRAAFQ